MVVKKVISIVGLIRIIIIFYVVLIIIGKTFSNLTMVKNVMKINLTYVSVFFFFWGFQSYNGLGFFHEVVKNGI